MAAEGQSFPKSARLLKRASFLRLHRTGSRLVTDHFVLLWTISGTQPPRLGITASKKVANAVGRNRVKRLVREVFRKTRSSLPLGLDLVIIARKGAPGMSLATVEREITSAVQRITRN